MTDHVLTSRNLLIHLALVPDPDAPLIIRRGLFGHEYTTVRATGNLLKPDLHIPFRRPLGELVIADAGYDQPQMDKGWPRRAENLRKLLTEIGELT